MLYQSSNGFPVQISVEIWPPLFAQGAVYHAIVSIATAAGVEYRRHETRRVASQDLAAADAAALIQKRGYKPWIPAEDRYRS